MPSWCNSVRVVLLIARGWRGTSLPRVSIRKEIHGGLCKEIATPMALFPTQHILAQGSLHYRLATLGYQKRNTYGVETFKPQHELRFLVSEFMMDYA